MVRAFARRWGLCHMIRKTMRIGEVRTSIKLESEFWDYLKSVSRPSAICGYPASSTRGLVGKPRTHQSRLHAAHLCLVHARLRTEGMQREMDKLALAGNTQDLARVLEACPLPALTIDRRAGDPPVQPGIRSLVEPRRQGDDRPAHRQHHDPARSRHARHVVEPARRAHGRAGFNATNVYARQGQNRPGDRHRPLRPRLRSRQARLRRDVRDAARTDLRCGEVAPPGAHPLLWVGAP